MGKACQKLSFASKTPPRTSRTKQSHKLNDMILETGQQYILHRIPLLISNSNIRNYGHYEEFIVILKILIDI